MLAYWMSAKNPISCVPTCPVVQLTDWVTGRAIGQGDRARHAWLLLYTEKLSF